MKFHAFLLSIVFVFCCFCAKDIFAMNHNLAWPWGDKPSPPFNPLTVFYSHQASDLLFDQSEPITIYCQSGKRSVNMNWTLCRNRLKTPFRKGEAEALVGNLFCVKLDPKGLIPGFYDLHVTVDSGTNEPTTGICVFGYKVGDMKLTDYRPKDFKEFWDKAKADLAKIAVDARNETEMEFFDRDAIGKYNVEHACLPPDYDPKGHVVETVESCKISVAGPDGGRVYGWLAKPQGKGPFPVMLVLPGAGFAARPRPLEHARHGYLSLDIQIHGQDVDLEGKYPTISGYNDHQVYTPADQYYFRNVHLRVLQIINYLCARPDADTSRFVVVGGSQGGRLGLIAAGLDNRVKAVVSCIANSPNAPYRLWAQQMDKEGKDGMDQPCPPYPDFDEGRCLAYYDPMNYVQDIECPVLMNSGLIDPVSPAYSTYVAFKNIASKNKTYVVMQLNGHDWSAAFDRQAWAWLDGVWGKK